MFIGTILWVTLAQSATAAAPAKSSCAQALADALADGAAAEICAGEDALRLANLAPRDSRVRARQLDAAAEHYRKAAAVASKLATKVLALNSFVDVNDAQLLNDPKEMEAALREVIRLTPTDLAPIFRLAKLQEDQGFTDSAEETLLDARHQHADAVDVYRMLAQFYARKVTALHKQDSQNESKPPTAPGERDENGVYRVGGPVAPPARLDVPRFPPEASAAGIKGAVVAEVVIDTSGIVSDAKVIQSIPLLDDAALQAVRNWHYAPTMVNGQPVPVRMTVTVNFTLPPTSPQRPPTAPPR